MLMKTTHHLLRSIGVFDIALFFGQFCFYVIFYLTTAEVEKSRELEEKGGKIPKDNNSVNNELASTSTANRDPLIGDKNNTSMMDSFVANVG